MKPISPRPPFISEIDASIRETHIGRSELVDRDAFGCQNIDDALSEQLAVGRFVGVLEREQFRIVVFMKQRRENGSSSWRVTRRLCRRFYPFVPFLAARTARDLRWKDVDIPCGTLVVLDVWATNHDPSSWARPLVFAPQRFRTRTISPYELVPQGGGDRETGHRSPGEDATIAVLTTLLPRLAELSYEFSHMPATIDIHRMPARIRGVITAG